MFLSLFNLVQMASYSVYSFQQPLAWQALLRPYTDACDVFIFIGLEPNTEPFRDLIHTDEWGFIATNQSLETNIPGVFAAGDVRAGSTKQAAAAAGEGGTAALMVRQYLERAGAM